MQKIIWIAAIACALALSGCKHAPLKPPATTAEAAGANANTEGAESAGANAAGAAVAGDDSAIGGPRAGLLGRRVVYFDYDRAEIRADGTEIVAAHAKYLASNPGTHIRLEGHTDERGTREYNIGLGERRAQAVRRAMLLQGAAEGQITTVSYGEERPAAAGSDESAWALNRRVEIVYLK
jgi:peptidoglycan-associated lipoprotein